MNLLEEERAKPQVFPCGEREGNCESRVAMQSSGTSDCCCCELISRSCNVMQMKTWRGGHRRLRERRQAGPAAGQNRSLCLLSVITGTACCFCYYWGLCYFVIMCLFVSLPCDEYNRVIFHVHARPFHSLCDLFITRGNLSRLRVEYHGRKIRTLKIHVYLPIHTQSHTRVCLYLGREIKRWPCISFVYIYIYIFFIMQKKNEFLKDVEIISVWGRFHLEIPTKSSSFSAKEISELALEEWKWSHLNITKCPLEKCSNRRGNDVRNDNQMFQGIINSFIAC